jgi:outer membrane immunogenic protein
MAPRYTKAPPPIVAPIYNWGGFYIGANVGAGELRQRLDNEFILPPSDILRYSGTGDVGIVGGVHAGWNYMVAPNFLIGLEAGYTGADLKQSVTQVQVSGLQRTESARVQSLWDVVGRVGLTSNNWLFYARGGYAGTRVDLKLNRTVDNLLQLTDSRTVSGYVVGGGVEWGVSPNWVLGVEGNYYNFAGGDRLLVNVPPTVPSNFRNVLTEVFTGVVRASYKFGGPVVAKY